MYPFTTYTLKLVQRISNQTNLAKSPLRRDSNNRQTNPCLDLLVSVQAVAAVSGEVSAADVVSAAAAAAAAAVSVAS